MLCSFLTNHEIHMVNIRTTVLKYEPNEMRSVKKSRLYIVSKTTKVGLELTCQCPFCERNPVDFWKSKNQLECNQCKRISPINHFLFVMKIFTLFLSLACLAFFNQGKVVFTPTSFGSYVTDELGR